MAGKGCCDPRDNICSCGPHGRMLEPRLLLLLNKKEAYGYELIGRLKQEAVPAFPFDVGAVYRSLREMDKAGLVRSAWTKGEAGPAKRIYQITRQGKQQLKEWAKIIEQRKRSLEKFMKLYKKGEQPC